MPGNSGKRRKTHHVETVLVDSSDSELEVTFLPATPLRRRSQQAGLACGISSHEYRNMKKFRIPGLFSADFSMLGGDDGLGRNDL